MSLRDIAKMFLTRGFVFTEESASLDGLATLLNQGRYAEAEPLFQQTLAILGQRLGSDHSHVAETLHDFPTMRERQGHCQEACVLYQCTLTIREQALWAGRQSTPSIT